MKRLILTTALALGLALPAMAQAARPPQPIYFWGSVAAEISAPGQPLLNPPVIRPSLIFLFADGSWDIDHLHWTGWGSSVAHATGISSASNGIPNEAQGKRILTPAQITLSNPGRFQGREVYRCFVLTDAHIDPVTDHPDGAYNCLETIGGFSFFGPATPPLPPKPLQRSLNGTIELAGACVKPLLAPGPSLCAGQIGRRAVGYVASFGATLGSRHPDHDSAVFQLIKKTGNVVQAHEWGVRLLPREVRINRSKVSIEVKHPIGPGGVDGEIDFTFSGRLHPKSAACVGKYNVVNGTITGTIRIKVGDRFFKTITVTRMRGGAQDTPVGGQGCNPPQPCLPPQYSLVGTTSYPANKPEVTLSAGTPPTAVARLAVDVTEPTAGTPFTVIDDSMVLGGTKSFLSLGPNLTSASVTTPGGVFSGGLSVLSSGGGITFPEACKGGHNQITLRPAEVTKGKITVTFDSIGKVSVDTNPKPSFNLESVTRVP